MENQLAYIAGVFDGEGCLIIGKYNRGNKNLSYRAYMAIANTHVPMLEYIQGLIGGKIVEQGKDKQCFSLSLTTNAIRKWLPQLVPFMVVKQKQAEVLLSFLERQAGNAFAPVSVELLGFYEECYQDMKRMKLIRFEYIRPGYKKETRKCKLCGSEFMWTSKYPKQLYCGKLCKKEVHWTRSNLRIRNGISAWNN